MLLIFENYQLRYNKKLASFIPIEFLSFLMSKIGNFVSFV
ncbi:hypothetical protein Fleli_1836 [Bernardetia litoralis DSM 6794]|uniref:Uncharacterized protein n=1 Tax=Bernardetia litoralis (strain ATCC 23117 / DSM 6794 / NBRC 15988 / NCIMB 1366 / Fx l1 / Sio-4) TaxID=880071 RepID=I4AJU9_BERLS|nr:hypothetical protein Fleli_1836 [Bernardetia litoralis DSM 6794]